MIRRMWRTIALDPALDDQVRRLVLTALVLALAAAFAWLASRAYAAEDRARALEGELATSQVLRERIAVHPIAQDALVVADAGTGAAIVRVPLEGWTIPGADLSDLRVSAAFPDGDAASGALVLAGRLRNAGTLPAYAVYVRARVLNVRGALLLDELAAFPGVVDPGVALPFRMDLGAALVQRPDAYDAKGWGRVQITVEYAGVAEGVGVIAAGR